MKTIFKTTPWFVISFWPKSRFGFYRSRLLLFLLLPVVCGHVSAEEGRFKYSTGFDYSSGEYNDNEETTIMYVPCRVGYEKGSFSGQLAVSWISIDGPGTVVNGGVAGVSQRESGIGDTWISLTYGIDALPYELGFLDVTGKLKIPTADENKGLGTGEFDEVLQIDYMYPLDRLTPMASLGYKWRGDPPGVDLNNSISCSVGADWRQTREIHIGASLDYQQASTDGMDDPLDLFSYVNYKTTRLLSITPYIYIGLSRGSSDIGGGLQLTFKP